MVRLRITGDYSVQPYNFSAVFWANKPNGITFAVPVPNATFDQMQVLVVYKSCFTMKQF